MSTARLTADTITDEEIRELRQSYSVPRVNALIGTAEKRARVIVDVCSAALDEHELREVCRACEGEGIYAASGTTQPHERRTRDSQTCRYCRGHGHILITRSNARARCATILNARRAAEGK